MIEYTVSFSNETSCFIEAICKLKTWLIKFDGGKEMLEIIIGIIFIAIGIILAIIFGYTETDKEGRRVNLFFTLVAVAFVMMGTISVVIELTEGLPKDTYSPCGDYMPPENSPLVVKMIHIENNFCYMTTAPYNNIDSVKQYYYQIPIKNIQDLGSIEVGTLVINDNSVLKPFKNN